MKTKYVKSYIIFHEENKIKPQEDATAYQLEWPKYRIPIIPNAGENEKQQEL